ncbi:hypothetical protein [Arthrobacter wenxiniae]|uniref:Uncharacterized protein n=1 Tax=Arthrobacter wenxiniae TaxID=2713570 RepID=A0A7Y7IH13_9MICC|nr:hypothetical protein [Arthrobacter wenxiniae]NVM94756.1 hypothetical protein [Arthrobacter wenxiniae]
MGTTRTTPPAGWELQAVPADVDPAGWADVYESRHQTKDGSTFVYGSWCDGILEIVVEQDGSEISLPSGWAARQLAELLYDLASRS